MLLCIFAAILYVAELALCFYFSLMTILYIVLCVTDSISIFGFFINQIESNAVADCMGGFKAFRPEICL